MSFTVSELANGSSVNESNFKCNCVSYYHRHSHRQRDIQRWDRIFFVVSKLWKIRQGRRHRQRREEKRKQKIRFFPSSTVVSRHQQEIEATIQLTHKHTHTHKQTQNKVKARGIARGKQFMLEHRFIEKLLPFFSSGPTTTDIFCLFFSLCQQKGQ